MGKRLFLFIDVEFAGIGNVGRRFLLVVLSRALKPIARSKWPVTERKV